MTERFRLAGPVMFWWAWVGFIVLNVTGDAVQGIPSARLGAVVYAILLLGTGLAYTLALRPKVIAAADGITVVNPYRTHFVPWRLVTFVDTAEWAQVHYAPSADGVRAGGAASAWAEGVTTRGHVAAASVGAAARTGLRRGFGAASGSAASSADGKTVHCWALYVSARARRKIASDTVREMRHPRDPLSHGALGLPGAGLGRVGSGWGARAGAAGPDDPDAPGRASSRLPAEARYLASLPPARAMAVRLDTRAGRERAKADNSKKPPQATATWSWPALAAVVIPALILLAVAVT